MATLISLPLRVLRFCCCRTLGWSWRLVFIQVLVARLSLARSRAVPSALRLHLRVRVRVRGSLQAVVQSGDNRGRRRYVRQHIPPLHFPRPISIFIFTFIPPSSRFNPSFSRFDCFVLWSLFFVPVPPDRLPRPPSRIGVHVAVQLLRCRVWGNRHSVWCRS